MAFSSTIFLSQCFSLNKVRSSSLLPKIRHTTIHRRRSFCSDCTTTPSSMPSFDLHSYWTSLISQIQEKLDTAITVKYPERIYEAMRYSVLSDSNKCASAIMCIAACELVGGDPSFAFPTACALEMVHAASLIHDDLPCMDAASLRRGSPTNHAVFGVDLAILAGDALFPLAFRHIVDHTPASHVPPQAILRVIHEIARTVGSTGMTAGQFLDLLPEGGEESADPMLVLEKKFGELAECSAVCGGVLGGAGEEECEALRRYGRAVGVLYVVVDDLLMWEEKVAGSNGPSGKMRNTASVVRAMGMDRAISIVEELRQTAKNELKSFQGCKFGDRVLPLYSFLDYAVERSFVVERCSKANNFLG
ncbi:hypothetical protein HPP92_007073 [Vanilla planifolia]|uniref:Uncharacterized protein n=1 Tax=Vanilla planifolia TaxID=51239 RepID=A0A835VAX5_VANPL|nr:hypothetical protein HPP92_007073 [Vanilla planifolia]